jgi:hypothetical protein
VQTKAYNCLISFHSSARECSSTASLTVQESLAELTAVKHPVTCQQHNDLHSKSNQHKLQWLNKTNKDNNKSIKSRILTVSRSYGFSDESSSWHVSHTRTGALSIWGRRNVLDEQSPQKMLPLKTRTESAEKSGLELKRMNERTQHTTAKRCAKVRTSVGNGAVAKTW